MKKLLALSLLLWSFMTSAQFHNPVSWSFDVEHNGNEAVLQIKATIEEGWHLYSQTIPEDGPIPTSFTFTPAESFELVGTVDEGEPHVEFDPNFDMELRYFGDEAVFTQKIKILSQTDFTLKGELEFMVCNDEMCLPPEYVDMSFDVKGSMDAAEASKTTITDEKPKESKSNTNNESLWGIFALGFGGGLVALLMPCIFPMIPLTVSFFTKQSKTKAEGIRKAIIYGVSIVAIYVALGMLVTLITGDSSKLNEMATNPWFNIAFFLLFVIFSISFFGAFEITLPSSWVNKADEASNKGGLAGVFFMAFTLSLVSFSCTGPIIGSLLVDAATKGSYLGPAMGMFGFSLALAIPFALFAAFPGWMNSLPKSGGWLNTVKVTLGFLELGFALKFLSSADLVWQAGWLPRELFIAIWVGLAFVTALYLFGTFKMPHDSPVDKIGVSRMLIGLVFVIFGFYLIPGIFGAPVKLISGFPPPDFYAESPGGFISGNHGSNNNEHNFGTFCPTGVDCFNDFDSGVKYAKEVGKPIMLDFTGFACTNCREMENKVWTDPRVHSMLANDYVLIELYVDDRTKLPEAEQRISEATGKKIKTIGNKFSEFQAINFKTNSQPYYVILGHDDLTPLIESTAHDLDIEKYVDWLNRGKDAFKSK